MSESFYARPPVMDKRNIRKKANDAESALRSFRRNYQEAKDENKKDFYEKSNTERSELLNMFSDLEKIMLEIPLEESEPILKAMSRIKETLESHPMFPPPLLREERQEFPFLTRKQSDTTSEVFHSRKTVSKRPKSLVASERKPSPILIPFQVLAEMRCK